MLEKEGIFQWRKFISRSELKQGHVVLFQYGISKEAKVEVMIVCRDDIGDNQLFLKSCEDDTERSVGSFTASGVLMNIRGGVTGRLIRVMDLQVPSEFLQTED